MLGFELVHPRPFHKEQLCMLFRLCDVTEARCFCLAQAALDGKDNTRISDWPSIK